ncbi:MAG: hypothetical protein JOY71_08605 [Acetobacteraceae bacterium]|nr:hypothetical protein [Acetobacteraceae bacterium]MBV8589781.1 hypothetical protein [Acetobacteraceae bacterium]
MSIVLGIARLAIGRADGFAAFGASPQAFLGSLAPLIAFAIVGAALVAVEGGGLQVLTGFLATVCSLLAPPVLSQALARVWRRDEQWLRYATAFNWCQWTIPVAGAILLAVLDILLLAGLSADAAGATLIIGLGAYGLWLHWFLLWRGLEVSVWRAALGVLGINFATAMILVGPQLVVWRGR